MGKTDEKLIIGTTVVGPAIVGTTVVGAIDKKLTWANLTKIELRWAVYPYVMTH